MRFILLIFLGLSASAFSNEVHSQDFKSLYGLKGQGWKGSEGHYMVLQFLASWCQGCGPTLGKLDKVAQGTKAIVVPVSVDEELAQAQSYFAGKEMMRLYEDKAYWDKGATLAKALSIEAIPSVVVLDRAGKEAMRIVGHPNDEQMSRLKAMIGKEGA